MLEIAIVGGGVHGTFLSHALTRETALDGSDIRVIDSYREPLYTWNRNTRACGMRFLRSPSSHNMDIDFHALRDFARQPEHKTLAEFREPYARPSLPLFQAHVRYLFSHYHLEEMRQQATVRDIELLGDRALLHTDAGETVETRNVVLAPGHSEHPFYPDWARASMKGDLPLDHVFEETFEPRLSATSTEPVVVGSGLSGCQLALDTAYRSGSPVTLIARHPLKVTHFDSNPCFIGPKCLRDFLQIKAPAARRERIAAERNPGTVPWDVAEQIQDAIHNGQIRFVVDEIAGTRPAGESRLSLELAQSAQALTTDRLLLATGFQRRPPAESLVAELAQRYDLPRGPYGYPVPDAALRWHPRLFVIGALGELELGPACLNIIGAHHAARRIVSLFKYGRPSEAPWTPLVRMQS